MTWRKVDLVAYEGPKHTTNMAHRAAPTATARRHRKLTLRML